LQSNPSNLLRQSFALPNSPAPRVKWIDPRSRQCAPVPQSPPSSGKGARPPLPARETRALSCAPAISCHRASNLQPRWALSAPWPSPARLTARGHSAGAAASRNEVCLRVPTLGSGEEIRDFVCVADVAAANILTGGNGMRPSTSPAAGDQLQSPGWDDGQSPGTNWSRRNAKRPSPATSSTREQIYQPGPGA
jgi:hypothetical protein